LFSQLPSQEVHVGFHLNFHSGIHLTPYSLEQVNCLEVKAWEIDVGVDSDESDFGDSVYGLTNSRLILIGNHVF
jgi:hypothetical protein